MKPHERVQVTAALVLAALPKEILGDIVITLAEKLAGALLTGQSPHAAEFESSIAAHFILLAARDNGVDLQVTEHGPENSDGKPAPEQYPEPTPEQIEQAKKLLENHFGTRPEKGGTPT